MNHIFLTVMVSVVLVLNSFPCAFAQSNLRDRSDKQHITLAQKNVGDAGANDRAFWDSVKDTNNPDELRAYLEEFPNGVFAKLARIRLKALETGGTQSQANNTVAPVVAGPKEIGRDGRFIAYDDGTILDTRTNLMWAAKDNGSDINWVNAKSYCEYYRGGGYMDWRMPTLDELAGLYDINKSYKVTQWHYAVSLTELIQLSTCCPWAFETSGSDAAHFCFDGGGRGWLPKSRGGSGRALPVRFVHSSANQYNSGSTAIKQDPEREAQQQLIQQQQEQLQAQQQLIQQQQQQMYTAPAPIIITPPSPHEPDPYDRILRALQPPPQHHHR